MWSSVYKRTIMPDLEMVGRILDKLNGVFDTHEYYHHSCVGHEMFEFTFQTDDYRREAWQITFMGKLVASGGIFGLDYDDCYEHDYLFLIQENAEDIYNQAYNGAIGYVSGILQYVANAEISKESKQNWISIINNGIDRIDEDKQKDNQYWASTKKLIKETEDNK